MKLCLCVLTLTLVSVVPAYGWQAGSDSPSNAEQKTLDGIRIALAKRNLDEAKSLLADAKQAGSPAYAAQLKRLVVLHDYLGQFWEAVSAGMKSLDALDELVVGKTRVAVVEVARGQIILRVAGQNRTYGMENMPPKLALTLADRALADAKQNLVFLAAFHLADKSGDRSEAGRLLNEAKRAGVDIGNLSEELQVTRPGLAGVDIPAMTPTMRTLLSSRRWIVFTNDGSRIKRSPLNGAKQNADGQLVIASADQPRLIAHQTRLAANFGCRLVLQSDVKGVRVGLHSTAQANQSITIEIPSGTSMIEIARQRGEWQCRLNGQETEVEISDETSAKISGNLGFHLPADAGCTIVAIELRTR